MLLGVGMLISEAFVTSYGVMGIGGVIALVIGSLLLIDTSKTDLAVQHSIIYGAAAALTVIILLIGYFVAREHGRVATTGMEGHGRRAGRGARSDRARFSRQGFRARRNLARAQRRRTARRARIASQSISGAGVQVQKCVKLAGFRMVRTIA